ncbi:MAG: hypothetical protein KW793_00965 [Candidatus Doudnabacteria bacterium]|nr:hypothetical protein [Candidatus Doudnabacteria bacterium]
MLKINSFYNFILLTISLLSTVLSVWIVYSLDPYQKLSNVFLFFLATGILVTSVVALVLYYFRQKFGVRELVHKHFAVSIRQGTLVGLAYVVGMLLQSKDLFTWLNSLFLVLALAFLEGYFIYSEKKSLDNQL